MISQSDSSGFNSLFALFILPPDALAFLEAKEEQGDGYKKLCTTLYTMETRIEGTVLFVHSQHSLWFFSLFMK